MAYFKEIILLQTERQIYPISIESEKKIRQKDVYCLPQQDRWWSGKTEKF
jgi:hypothetical protein